MRENENNLKVNHEVVGQFQKFVTKTYETFLEEDLGVGGGGLSPTFLITVGDNGRSFVLLGVGAGGFINIDRSTVNFFSGCPPNGVAAFKAEKTIKII